MSFPSSPLSSVRRRQGTQSFSIFVSPFSLSSVQFFSVLGAIFTLPVKFTKSFAVVLTTTVLYSTARTQSLVSEGMLRLIGKFKITNSVICLNFVFMVNNLISRKIPAQVFFHNKTMFKNVSVRFGEWVVRKINPSVPSVVFTHTYSMTDCGGM